MSFSVDVLFKLFIFFQNCVQYMAYQKQGMGPHKHILCPTIQKAELI